MHPGIKATLDERLQRGEITLQQYKEKVALIEGSSIANSGTIQGPSPQSDGVEGRDRFHCQFCRELMARNAMVCPHCRNARISESEIETALDRLTSKFKFVSFLLVVAGFFIAWYVGLIVLILACLGLKFYKNHLHDNLGVVELFRRSNALRRKRQVSLVVIVLLLAVALASNPSKEKHHEKLAEGASDWLAANTILPAGIRLPRSLTSMAINRAGHINHRNYYAFSLTLIEEKDGTSFAALGIFGCVFTIFDFHGLFE